MPQTRRRRRPPSDEEGLRPLTDPGIFKTFVPIALLLAILGTGLLLLIRGVR